MSIRRRLIGLGTMTAFICSICSFSAYQYNNGAQFICNDLLNHLRCYDYFFTIGNFTFTTDDAFYTGAISLIIATILLALLSVDKTKIIYIGNEDEEEQPVISS